MKLLASLLETESKRQLAFKLQQELVELLPDDFDVLVTQHFQTAGQYMYGKVAVKVKHPSYSNLIGGYVLVFPHSSSAKLIYNYRGEFERAIEYDKVSELANDLEKNIQTNSV